MINRKFKGTIENGKLKLDEEIKFLKHIATLDGVVEIVIKKFRKKRTMSQNNLYWLYLGLISEWNGDTPEDLHEYFKRKFLPAKSITAWNETIKIPQSTTDLKSGEFGEYLDKIEDLTQLPIPDPQLLMEQYEIN